MKCPTCNGTGVIRDPDSNKHPFDPIYQPPTATITVNNEDTPNDPS